MFHNSRFLCVALLSISLAFACARPQGATREEKLESIEEMKNKTLEQLYIENPETKTKIANAPGYAVFSNIGTGLLIFGTGQGYGVAVNNRTGHETFMRMAELSVGLGVQIKDFREVIIFNNKRELYDFIEKGWDFGGEASAAAKSDEEGGGYSAAASYVPDVEVYQITEKGIALRGGLTGSKYWKDKDLN